MSGPTRPWPGGGLAARIALAAALAVAGFGVVRGTWAVGGSDSSCYGLMADAFAHGTLQPVSLLAREAPWADAARTFAPAGFIPSPTRSFAASPICAPGFAIVLAPFRWIAGREGIFVVTPLAGALLIWLTFVFGRQMSGAFAGAAAAVVVATAPVLLFQAVQPMNDVLVAALWMAVLVAASLPDPTRPWMLGGLSGLAVLVRPNLAPAALVVGGWLVLIGIHARRLRETRRQAVAFAMAFAPFAAVVLALNHALYGSPFGSGYGSAAELFSAAHVMPNLTHYASALWSTQLGFPLIGVAAWRVVARTKRALAWLVLAVSGSIVIVYLPYQPFDEWWYLRFLLPALVPLTTLAAASMTSAVRATDGPQRRLVIHLGIAAIVATIALFGLNAAADRQVFALQRLERRFRMTGDLVRDALPANSVFITIWHSGTLRFHAGRESALWDSLEPRSLDRAVDWFLQRGLEPFIVVERWEEPLFRERFAKDSAVGNLDWPPRFDVDRQVRIFRPDDRSVYLRGEQVPTEYVRAPIR